MNQKKIAVIKLFSEYDTNLSKTLKAVFKEIIKPFYKTGCKPLPSMPLQYLAKTPILLYDLIQKLEKYDYKVLRMVLNLNGKVIGVIAENPYNLKGFIPCYPSALNNDLKKEIDYILMTDPSIWNTYDNTYEFLTILEKRSSKKRLQSDIPCKPIFKIVEDGMVVGILTETNQFIQISNPVPENDINPKKNITSIKDNNYIIHKNKTPFTTPMVPSDVIITTSKKVDDARVEYITKIKLESNFYNVFRNTIKILLNDYDHVAIREKIEDELGKEYIIYSRKLKIINDLLEKLVDDNIRFTGDKNYYKLIGEVSTCIVKDKKSCKENEPLCAIIDNGKCKLILPEKNLITDKLNKPMYYGKIADEIIRYSRINSFMFQPNTYLAFGNIGYNLRDNEIIMLQSLLTQEYFENLIPAATNKYIRYNSYDEAEPILTQTYENNVPSLDVAIGRKNKKECQKVEKNIISPKFWKDSFPENFKEVVYSKFSYCTFVFIIDLIEKKTGEKLTINEAKNYLFEEYKKYITKYNEQIIDILIFEGKKTLGDQVKGETLTFASLIYTDNYFLTPFDLWLFVKKYKIPTIFISQTPIKILTNNKRRSFVAYGEKEDKFTFIIVPGLRAENVPGFKFIETYDQDIFISLDKINDGNGLSEINKSFDNKESIETFLNNFKKPQGNIHVSKKNIIIQDEEEDQEEEEQKEKEKGEKVIPKRKEKIKKVNVKKIIIQDEEEEKQPAVTLKKENEPTKKNRVIINKNKQKKTKKNVKQNIVIVSENSEN